MAGCDLCGLPTPNPPITDSGGFGRFCCPGCVQVAATLEDVEKRPTIEADRGHADADDAIPDDASVAYFVADGMHCTSCEIFLRIRGENVDGVYRVEANYGLDSLRVYYDSDRLTEDTLASRLSGHGYTIHTRDPTSQSSNRTRQREETIQRLLIGGFFTMLIMPWYLFNLYPQYVGLGGGLLELGRTTTFGIFFPLVVIGVMTTIVLVYTGYPVLRGAWISVRTRHPNMDLLVSIAALAAYVYSVVALALGRTHLYFDVTVMVIMVVTLGRYYEGQLRDDATNRIAEMTNARVNEAVSLLPDGRERVPVDALDPGDRVLVTPGEQVPIDGQITDGRAAVDESFLTGESRPVRKSDGDSVLGGSTVIDGTITVSVGPSATSAIDRVVTSMWDIQSDTGGVQRFADALATIFVPVVLLLGITVTAWQLGTGTTVATALLAGLTVLLVSCPCAMGLATPLAISAGLRDSLRNGIVVTNDAVFERAPDADVVIFDKTGTVTSGEMSVSSVIGDERTIRYGAALEQRATHPISDAIIAAYRDGFSDAETGFSDPRAECADVETGRSDAGPFTSDGGTRIEPSNRSLDDSQVLHTESLPDVERFESHPGAGVSGIVDGQPAAIGTPELVTEIVGPIDDDLRAAIESVTDAGGIPVVVGWAGAARGVVSLVDRTRESWVTVIDQFADRTVVILTGDDSTDADRFDTHSAVDHVFTGVPPAGKVETVRRFQADGTTVMIGDGTNDAPSLAAADLGIAMGDGTADASEAGDAVLLENDLRDVGRVFDLARGTRRRIRENIAWALLYNVIAIPLAVVGLINPFFAAVAMATSSVIVVTNSRRAVSK